MSEIIIYETENQIEVEVTYEKNSLWLNLNQISELFERDKSVISRHIKNIHKEGELHEYATVAKNATVQEEGSRIVSRKIEYYNLDVFLAVGYSVRSSKYISIIHPNFGAVEGAVEGAIEGAVEGAVEGLKKISNTKPGVFNN